MREIRTRCVEGWLVVTDDYIRIELPGQIRQITLLRSKLTGVESKLQAISVFGLGGGQRLTFHGQGTERIHASMVKPSIAKEIVSLLSKSNPQNQS